MQNMNCRPQRKAIDYRPTLYTIIIIIIIIIHEFDGDTSLNKTSGPRLMSVQQEEEEGEFIKLQLSKSNNYISG